MNWEYFFDESYFHLWAVRPKGDKDFNSDKLFHITDKKEAERLCQLLNEYEDDRQNYQDTVKYLQSIINYK